MVLDSSSKQPIEAATVLLHFPNQSTPFRAINTDEDGSFAFDSLPLRNYDVVITSIGYSSKKFSIATPLPVISLDTIFLKPVHHPLTAVKIIANKALVKFEADKIIYNVDADPDRFAFNTLEMLRKLPGIVVDAEDNIELNGNTSFEVLLNGRRSSLFVRSVEEVFKSLPATSVKSIEIITTPTARYDSEGTAGIINIITESKTILGYNVSLRAGYQHPGRPTGGGTIMARVGKVGISGIWGYSDNHNPTTTNDFNRTDKRNNIRMVQAGESYSRYKNIFGNAELTYQFTEASLLSAHYNSRQGEGSNHFLQQVKMTDAAGALLQAYSNIMNGTSSTTSEDFGADLQLGSKKAKDRLLTISAKEVRDGNSYLSQNTLEPKVGTAMSGGRNTNGSRFRERTAQIDYVHPMGKLQMEMGVKSMTRLNNSNSFIERLNSATGEMVSNPDLNNGLENMQVIHTGYLSLSLRAGKWLLRTGARFEKQYQRTTFYRAGRTISRQNYENFIPNATLSKRFGSSTNFNVSYTQRLQRPSLFYLNPFVNNFDPYNIDYGNPDLQPTLSHVFNMAFNTSIKRTSFNLNLYHNFTNNSILGYTTVGVDTVARSTYGNIGSESSSGGSLGMNFSLGQTFNFGFSGNGGHLRYTSNINNQLTQNEGITYGFNHNGGVTVKTWRFSYNAGYTSARISVQGRNLGYYNHSATLAKSLLKGRKGNINLTVSNPFQPFRINRTEFDQPTFFQVRHSQMVMRRFSFTFNYRFGKLQSGVKQKKRGITNDDLKAGIAD